MKDYFPPSVSLFALLNEVLGSLCYNLGDHVYFPASVGLHDILAFMHIPYISLCIFLCFVFVLAITVCPYVGIFYTSYWLF